MKCARNIQIRCTIHKIKKNMLPSDIYSYLNMYSQTQNCKKKQTLQNSGLSDIKFLSFCHHQIYSVCQTTGALAKKPSWLPFPSPHCSQMVRFPQYHGLSLDARRILFTRAFLTLSEDKRCPLPSLEVASFFRCRRIHSATCASQQ